MSSSTSVATFSGLGSGLPVDQLISATMAQYSTRLNKYNKDLDTANAQKSAYSTIKTKYSSFESAVQKILDSKLMYSYDLFDKKKIDLSDSSIASVATSKGAATGTIEVKVNKLATPPQVSISGLGSPITANVKLADIGIVDAPFSLAFIKDDGTGVSVTAPVYADDTLTTYMARLNDSIAKDSDGKATGLGGSVSYNVDSNGVVTLDFSGVTGGKLNTTNPYPNSQSNFADVLGLAPSADGTKLVSKPTAALNLDGKLSDNSVGFKNFDLSTLTLPETINIGGMDIEVTADTTLRQIMNKVNDESSCQVKMMYNQTTNTMTIKGKDGFFSDNLYFSGKAFLSQMGLTDANGVVDVSKQTVRQPGEIVVDGKTLAIKSNKVTAADTGLTGVTINLKSVTKDDPLTITIADNTDGLTTAIQNMVDSFNSIVSTVGTYTYVDTTDTSNSTDSTDASGVLSSDFTVQSMQTTLGMMFTTPVTDKLAYKSLAMIGFSMEDGKMKFDKDTFLNALSDNNTDVQTLMIGTKDKSVKGVLEKIMDQVDQYMDYSTGFFATKTTSLNNSITSLNKSITSEQDRLDDKRAALVQQYSNLDSLVSKYQSQSSAFTS
jgi:flagellar hook-associated protein 2